MRKLRLLSHSFTQTVAENNIDLVLLITNEAEMIKKGVRIKKI